MTVTAREGLEARNNLQQIAAAWPALHAALRPGSSNALTGMPGTSPERPAPINLHISDLMFEIQQEAEALAHTLMDETLDTDGRPWQPKTSAMPELLLEVADHYGHWTAADDRTAHNFCDWAEQYATKVHGTLTQDRQRPTHMGDCPKTLTADTNFTGETFLAGDPCPGSLTLRPGATTMTCPVCHTPTTVDQQRANVERRVNGTLLTQAELRAALNVMGHDLPWSTLNSWVRREKLTPAYTDIDDTPYYDLADGRALAQERSQRRAHRDNVHDPQVA